MDRETEPKIGGILLRVSSNKQAEEGKTSYIVQLNDCLKYAAEHNIIVPADLRWQNVAKRDQYYTNEALQAAVKALEQGRVQVLIVWKWDRITDKWANFRRVLEACEEHHATPVSATEPGLDLSTEQGRSIMHVIMAFGIEPEREKIKQRTNANKMQLVRQGRPLASNRPRYGYKWIQDPTRTIRRGDAVAFIKEKLEQDPEAAAVVQQVFAWADEGKTLHWIARALSGDVEGGRYKQPTPSEHAGKPGTMHPGIWDTAAVHQMLKFEGYAGRRWPAITTKQEKRTDGTERFETIHLPESEWTWIEPSIGPGLVSYEQWARVQVQLGNNKRFSPRSGERRYGPNEALLYGGMARCGVVHEDGNICDKSASPHPRGGGLQYRCVARTRIHPDCPGIFITTRILDEAVIVALGKTLQHPENIARLARTAVQKELVKTGDLKVTTPVDTYHIVQKKLEKAESMRQYLITREADPDIDEPTRQGYMMSGLKETAEVQRLEEDCERARKAAAQYERVEQTVETLEFHLKRWEAQSEHMVLGYYTPDLLRRCLEDLGARVIVHPHSATGPIATLQLHLTRLEFGATIDDEQGAVNIPVPQASPRTQSPSQAYLSWHGLEEPEASSVSSSS